MARTYLVACPDTHIDGEALDAWTARTRIQERVCAVYEEARIDQTTVLDAPYEMALLDFVGPMPVWMRKDRNGRWRDQYFQLLICGGSADPEMVFRVVMTPSWYRPRGGDDYLPDGSDPYVDFIAPDGNTPTWSEPDVITIPSWFDPHRYSIPDGDEAGVFRLAWAVVMPIKEPGEAPPLYCGLRHYESVGDEA